MPGLRPSDLIRQLANVSDELRHHRGSGILFPALEKPGHEHEVELDAVRLVIPDDLAQNVELVFPY